MVLAGAESYIVLVPDAQLFSSYTTYLVDRIEFSSNV
jgi:hypothetical protein